MSVEGENPELGPNLGKQISVLPLPLQARRGLVTRTLDLVIPEKNKYFTFFWLLAIFAVLALFNNIQGEATQFYGIAEGQQQSISFQYPVEIVDVAVVEGAQVEKDATLLQVRRYDLNVDLATIDEKINEIMAQQSSARHGVSAEIARLKAERLARTETLNTRIDSLESEYRLNQALVSKILGDSADVSTSVENPVLTQLDGMRAEKQQLGRMYQAQIESQQQKLVNITGPDEARIAELRKQKSELQRQTEALVVRADFSGSVGSVMSKPGEQVDAFSPVISIHSTTTQHIKGYINEAVINHIQVGQTVWVKPLGASSKHDPITGVVESLGSRIVEYPARLKRNPMIPAWGREAVINLEPGNHILLGEKVSVLLHEPEPLFAPTRKLLEALLPMSDSRAWTGEGETRPYTTPLKIESSIDRLPGRQIEASGITPDPVMKSYSLLNDEYSARLNLIPDGEITASSGMHPNQEAGYLANLSQHGFDLYVAAACFDQVLA